MQHAFSPPEPGLEIAGVPGRIVLFLAAGVLCGLAARQLVSGAAGNYVFLIALVAAVALGAIRIDAQPPEVWAASRASYVMRRWRPRRFLARVSIVEALESAGGVIRQPGRRGELTLSAVLEIAGQAMPLLEDEDQETTFERWGRILDTLGGDHPRVHRLQLLQILTPVPNSGHIEHIETSGDPSSPVYNAYRREQLEQSWRPRRHQLLVLQVATKSMHESAALAAQRSEVANLRQQLVSVFGTMRQLSKPEIGWLLSCALDPASADLPNDEIAELPLDDLAELRDHVRCGRFFHRTYGVTAWPSNEVTSSFLFPLLLELGGIHAASFQLTPVPQSLALRRAASAQTQHVSDLGLRARAGFLDGQLRKRRRAAAVQREAELAKGHQEYRLEAYVRVTAASLVDLEAASARLRTQTRQCQLAISPLHYRQLTAFLSTLPLGAVSC